MKRFKTKKRNNKKLIISILLFLLLIITFILLSTIKLDENHAKIISYTLNQITKEKQKINEINIDNLMNIPTFNLTKKPRTKENHNIYIYNTHNNEKYNDGTKIMDVSHMLKDNLAKLGINSTMEENNTNKYLNNKINYYDISRIFLNKAINDNKYQYFIDIHRDDATDTKISLNNKKYAKVLFVLGLDNPHYQENKEILEKMNNYLNEYYPRLSKGILEKKGESVNGIYNQDLNKNVLLIEIGGIENTKEEINNSTEIIALMLYYMLGD